MDVALNHVQCYTVLRFLRQNPEYMDFKREKNTVL